MDHFGIKTKRKPSSKIDAKLSDTWESLSFLPSVPCRPERGYSKEMLRFLQHHCSATLALQLLVPWLLLHLELSHGSEQSFLSPVVLQDIRGFPHKRDLETTTLSLPTVVF